MSTIVTKTSLSYFAQAFYDKCQLSFDAIGSANTAEANAKTYADGLNTAMDTRVGALETTVGDANGGLVKDVAVLKGDVNTEGSVAYQIAQIIAGADAKYDTLKEIADWIMSDTTGAAKMASDISELQALVGSIPEGATSTNVFDYIKEYCDGALADSDLSQYAKAEDLEALEGVVGVAGNGSDVPATGLFAEIDGVEARVEANEEAIETLNGADTVEGSVAKALKDAKAYTDEKDTAMDERVTALETAVGVESDTENGVAATGIYARLEALEVPVTNDDIDDIINGLQ